MAIEMRPKRAVSALPSLESRARTAEPVRCGSTRPSSFPALDSNVSCNEKTPRRELDAVLTVDERIHVGTSKPSNVSSPRNASGWA
jgi:hypothetical protein